MTSEEETRQQLIDRQLRLAGWDLRDPTQVVEEHEIDLVKAGVLPPIAAEVAPPYYGKQFADYVLLTRGRVIAVLEAKKTSKDAQLGQEQALQYAENIQRLQGGRIPFVMYSNGHDAYLWEYDVYPPVKVLGLPSQLDLEWMDQRREGRKPLSVELINTSIAGRDYQIAAIRAVLEGVEAKRRRFLLVMATGTGKTRVAMGLIDVLLRAHWAKRVLFLVDRVALRDQAIDAFRENLPDSPYWPRTEGHTVESAWAGNRRLYCTTYQTMLNLIEAGTTPETRISPHFFDLVIADESHRSIYNIYQSVLDWFGGIRLGLTATPRDHIEHDTFALFECESHDPTYAFTYEEAIEHEPPYLCGFRVLKVRSKFQLEGIQGGTLPEPVQKRLIAEGKDPYEIDFEGSELERKVTNAGTNAVIVREFMEECIKDPTGTLPGKTIFFALSKGHARRLAEIFDQLYPEHAGRLARVLVSEDPRVHGKGGLLDQFKHSDMPRVALSVDMLDTGIDVPEVVNLVFAKPVFSYTKFWQMIGRGTRVLPAPAKRKPWCPDKDEFLIIDCWANFDFFKMRPEGREPKAQVALPVRLFHSRLDLLEAATDAGAADGVSVAIEGLRADLAALPEQNAVVSANRKDLAPVLADEFWNHLTPTKLAALRSAVAPLLRARSVLEPKAVRFEMEAVQFLGARLRGGDIRKDDLRDSVQEQLSELPMSVNTVAEERQAIEQALRPGWWDSESVPQVWDITKRLAPLMRFRQAPRDPLLRLDLADLTAIKEALDFGPSHEGRTSEGYRDRVEAFIRSLVATHPVLARIAAGETPGEVELAEVAEILRQGDPAVTEEALRRAYDVRAAGLTQLLRHVLGLEHLPSWGEAVTAALDGFIARHTTLSQLQIRFLQTLRTFLLQNRQFDRSSLFAPPFTQLHPSGVRGVFPGPELQEVVAMAEGLVAGKG